MKKIFTLIIGLVIGMATDSSNSAEAAGLKAGDKAPACKLTGSDGKMYDLSEITKDKVVVLAWYPKAFTGG